MFGEKACGVVRFRCATMNDPLSDAPTATSTLVVERKKPTEITEQIAVPAALRDVPAGRTPSTHEAEETHPSVTETQPTIAEKRARTPVEQPTRALQQPPPPPPQAILESRIAAMSRPDAPTVPDLSVDFAPWAMSTAATAGIIAARPLVPPPAFLIELDTTKADELRKVIAALTGQSKKNFTIESLIGVAPPESLLSTLSVRRVTTANVAFSKRAQQLTSSGKDPALCLLRLERDEHLLEARVTIRQSRGKTPSVTMQLAATVATTIAEDIAAFEELRAAIGALWARPKAGGVESLVGSP